MKQIILLFMLTAGSSCFAQKKLLSDYSGGHGCIDTRLRLYNDSTYLYESTTAMMIVHTSRKRGYWLRSDSLITFFRKKSQMISASAGSPAKGESYRVKGNSILMYSVRDERSKDSSYIKAYYTMSVY